MSHRQFLVLAVIVWSFVGCGHKSGSVEALFVLDETANEDYFALPYPNDLRRNADGSIDVAAFPSHHSQIAKRVLDRLAQAPYGGFGTSSAAFFRFTGGISDDRLPKSARESLEPDASVIWVNIDPLSPRYGERIPFRSQFRREKTLYIESNSLTIVPEPGFVLEPNRRYAVLLTNRIVDEQGEIVRRSTMLDTLLAEISPTESDERIVRAYEIYRPLRAFLDDSPLGFSIGARDLVNATVFTTGDPTQLMRHTQQALERIAPPRIESLRVTQQSDTVIVVEGMYRAPNFQSGTSPFLSASDGGAIQLDAQGVPQVARIEPLRVAISIPKSEMPKTGWPVVLFAHGTGGDYQSFVRNGMARDLANVVDDRGKTTRFAVVSIDQNMNGKRIPEGFSADIAFFNIENPVAAVDNIIQGAIDFLSLRRAIASLTFSSLPSSDGDRMFKASTSFDAQRIFFVGHSQGALSGPLFLAVEPHVNGAVLSATAGSFIHTLLEKRKPVDIATLVQSIVQEPVDLFHPALNMMQQMMEPADPNNYAAALVRNPPPGVWPKQLLLSEGFVDHYTPNPTIESFATAVGLPHLGDVISSIEGLALQGLTTTTLPVSDNLLTPLGYVTGGLVQYYGQETQTACVQDKDCDASDYCDRALKRCRSDGHFALFNRSEGRKQLARFLASLAQGQTPTISAP